MNSHGMLPKRSANIGARMNRWEDEAACFMVKSDAHDRAKEHS